MFILEHLKVTPNGVVCLSFDGTNKKVVNVDRLISE